MDLNTGEVIREYANMAEANLAMGVCPSRMKFVGFVRARRRVILVLSGDLRMSMKRNNVKIVLLLMIFKQYFSILCRMEKSGYPCIHNVF